MISFNEATKAASRGETLFQNCFCWAWHLSNSTVPVNTCLHGSLAIDCIKLHQFKVFSWKLWGITVMEMHRWIPHLCLNFSLVTRLWWWDFFCGHLWNRQSSEYITHTHLLELTLTQKYLHSSVRSTLQVLEDDKKACSGLGMSFCLKQRYFSILFTNVRESDMSGSWDWQMDWCWSTFLTLLLVTERLKWLMQGYKSVSCSNRGNMVGHWGQARTKVTVLRQQKELAYMGKKWDNHHHCY